MELEQLLIESEYMLRILVASVCGCIIGFERKNRNKEAGMKTHAIVALGSALIMVISKYCFTDVPMPDSGRIAAQVVSGIGFLGAGIIFVKNNVVSGLTTAAGVWATCGIGLAVGSGRYFIGVMSTVLMILVQIVLHSRLFSRDIAQDTIVVVIKNDINILKDMKMILERENVELTSIEINRLDDQNIRIEASVSFYMPILRERLHEMFLENDNIVSYKIQ